MIKAAIFTVFVLFSIGINAKSCADSIKELASKPTLLGAFKPICQSNGKYAETQCHEGFCYCVFPETGEEIMGTRLTVRGQKPKSCKSPCVMQRHQTLSAKVQLLGAFKPQCNEDGSYKSIQCKGAYCYCVFTNGKEILGTKTVRGTPKSCSNNAKSCADSIKELATKPTLLGAFKPICQSNGKYAKTQCHENYCFCVMPESGEEILGTRKRGSKPQSCDATPCLLQRHKGLKAGPMAGAFLPQCGLDGSFSTTQCHGSTGYCYCVFPETGEKVLGTEIRFNKPQTCELTACIQQRHDIMKVNPPLLGAFQPKCKADGTYEAVQCHEGFCYCVFTETGEEIMGTRLTVRGQKPKSCNVIAKSPCVMQRNKALSAKVQLYGAFKPQCNEDGSYKSIQCKEGYCYCVFTNGKEILGTKTGRGTEPKSCKLTKCVLKRHNAWNFTLGGFLGVPVARCNDYGLYDKVQCAKGMCWCVDPETGEAVKGKPAQFTIPKC